MAEEVRGPKGREVTMPQHFLIISHVLTIVVTAYFTAFFHDTLRVSSGPSYINVVRSAVVFYVYAV